MRLAGCSKGRDGMCTAAVITRWIARVWSIASLVFVGAFAAGSGAGGSFPSASEAVGLALFPVAVLAGMAIAWRWQGIGGAITTISLAAFYLWMAILDRLPRGPYFALVAAPGFLFLIAWFVERSQRSLSAEAG